MKGPITAELVVAGLETESFQIKPKSNLSIVQATKSELC